MKKIGVVGSNILPMEFIEKSFKEDINIVDLETIEDGISETDLDVIIDNRTNNHSIFDYRAGYSIDDYQKYHNFEYSHLTKKQKEADIQPIRTEPKIGRNSICPCGSGKKYKNCCLKS